MLLHQHVPVILHLLLGIKCYVFFSLSLLPKFQLIASDNWGFGGKTGVIRGESVINIWFLKVWLLYFSAFDFILCHNLLLWKGFNAANATFKAVSKPLSGISISRIQFSVCYIINQSLQSITASRLWLFYQ